MFIIRLASDALSSLSEAEQNLIHLTDGSPPTSQYELIKKKEILQNSNDTMKALHSIKRVHRLIEEELMTEYDMKTMAKTERNNNHTKLSRYREKDQFCTPYSIRQNKNDSNVRRNSIDRSVVTPKKCSSATSLLYDLLSGKENFHSVYMRSQLVFATCDNTQSANKSENEDFHTKRKIRNQPTGRRRKSLRPTKHCPTSCKPGTSIETNTQHLHYDRSTEKFSSSSSPSSSPSSSSMLSPSNISVFTHYQTSPIKLFDKHECLTNNHTLHSQSPVDCCSTVPSVSTPECFEQPLDLSSTSRSYRLCLSNNLPHQSGVIAPKRRRSFAGDVDYTSRLSDGIQCTTQRHNSITLPLLSSKTISTFSNNSTPSCSSSSSGSSAIHSSDSNSRPESKPSEASVHRSDGQVDTVDNAVTLTSPSTANFFDFISSECYGVALSAALAVCASSVLQSIASAPNYNNNDNNNLLNSCNSEKIAYELAYELLTSLSNSSGTISAAPDDISTTSNVINPQECKQKLLSPKLKSKLLFKSISLSKCKTGDKSLSKLNSFKKSTYRRTISLPNRPLNQHSNHTNNQDHIDYDRDITRHSFTSSPIKPYSQDSIFLHKSFHHYKHQIRQWFIQMINLVKQPEVSIISLLQNNIEKTTMKESNFRIEKQMTHLLSSFILRILCQSIDIRFKLLNMSWYRLLVVYLIEYHQLELLTIDSPLSSSSSSSSFDGNEVNDEKLIVSRKFGRKYLINNKEIVASMCYSLEFNHSVYNLIRIGLLIIGERSEPQYTSNVQLLEQTLLEYVANSTNISDQPNSDSALRGCRTGTVSPPSTPSLPTTTTTPIKNLNTPTNTTTTSSFNCGHEGSSSIGSNSTVTLTPAMTHTLLQKLIKIPKDAVIFLLSNQLGDSIESLFNKLLEISKV
ncbi:unnamed protein product [Heterobilharzia americana]|nr:unnamed protein product [Heterobilharzia americana]